MDIHMDSINILRYGYLGAAVAVRTHINPDS
jgi:hypothetical protein